MESEEDELVIHREVFPHSRTIASESRLLISLSFPPECHSLPQCDKNGWKTVFKRLSGCNSSVLLIISVED